MSQWNDGMTAGSMTRRFLDRLKFVLELQIQRGARQQLLIMISLIVLVAAGGGLWAWILTDAFQNPAEAVWWAFLRLTDPGYLGDDEGVVLRIISTVVTVLGYVLFMGSLIAIMTQWLNRMMRTLESGLTPISMKNHFLILGWTNRTASLVKELVLSEGRVQRFLQRRGANKLKIVILSEEVDTGRRQELRDAIGKDWRRGQIFLRSGSSMRIEHLRRVDFTRASAIILPGADYELGGAESVDSRVIKTLMSISKFGEQKEKEYSPVVVAEIFDAWKAPIAVKAYRGQIHILASDAFISRLIAQNVRHRGLSHVYSELLSHTHGNEVYVRTWPVLTGKPFSSITRLFPKAVVLGVVRPENDAFRPLLNPSAPFILQEDDRLVMIANSYDDAAPEEDLSEDTAVEPVSESEPPTMPLRRVLILGWSHKAAALVHEFGSYPEERFDIDIVSVIPAEERNAAMHRIVAQPGQVSVRQVEGDYTREADLRKMEPARYDNIVFLGSDWLDSSEETDARTILGYVLLRSVLPADRQGPEILVELKDPSNERLFNEHTGEVIISPIILSHMLAHSALRQELTSVFSELFGPGGAEIFFRPAGDYQLEGKVVAFRDVQRSAALRGEIALGVRVKDPAGKGMENGVYLNPSRQHRWIFDASDEVVVLTRYS